MTTQPYFMRHRQDTQKQLSNGITSSKSQSCGFSTKNLEQSRALAFCLDALSGRLTRNKPPSSSSASSLSWSSSSTTKTKHRGCDDFFPYRTCMKFINHLSPYASQQLQQFEEIEEPSWNNSKCKSLKKKVTTDPVVFVTGII